LDVIEQDASVVTIAMPAMLMSTLQELDQLRWKALHWMPETQ
jgi:hypothetical protein